MLTRHLFKCYWELQKKKKKKQRTPLLHNKTKRKRTNTHYHFNYLSGKAGSRLYWRQGGAFVFLGYSSEMIENIFLTLKVLDRHRKHWKPAGKILFRKWLQNDHQLENWRREEIPGLLLNILHVYGPARRKWAVKWMIQSQMRIIEPQQGKIRKASGACRSFCMNACRFQNILLASSENLGKTLRLVTQETYVFFLIFFIC